LGTDFGERWHTDPGYRRDSLVRMGRELRRRFPGLNIGWISDPEAPGDLLTGTFGACTVAAIYGVPIVYASDNWPSCAHQYLSAGEVSRLEPPDLRSNAFFSALMEQVEWIGGETGPVAGYINWQGVLNSAYRLRGLEVFSDIALDPPCAHHLFGCICATMIEGAKLLYGRQEESGFAVRHFTLGNCLVNMLSPEHYRELLLPHDMHLAEEFGCLGIHNCAWTADPYLDAYAEVPHVAYVDMGQESDLRRARELFPQARRAIMYKPTDLASKPLRAIRRDFARIARDYGPCDIVLADIEAGTPDERIMAAAELCSELGQTVRSY